MNENSSKSNVHDSLGIVCGSHAQSILQSFPLNLSFIPLDFFPGHIYKTVSDTVSELRDAYKLDMH